MRSIVYYVTILEILSPLILCHVIITDKKSNSFNTFDRLDDVDRLFLEPLFEYPMVTKMSATPTPATAPIATTRHSHIGKIPKKGTTDPSSMSVLLPEAIVYIGGGNNKNGGITADSFGVPSYAEKGTKNVEILTDNSISSVSSSSSADSSLSSSSVSSDKNNNNEPKEDKVRYRDILVALALWNLANTFNQYETGSYESAASEMANNLNGFQTEPISQEIKLRSNEILKFNKS